MLKITKQWIIPLIMLLSTVSLKAQVLSESFEGSFLPDEWTLLNYEDENTFESYSSASLSHTGSKCVKISYSTDAHNDWLITPKLSITNSTDSIHFWAKNQSSSFTEKFHVKLSNFGSDTASFTTILASSQEPSSVWQKYSFSLGSFVSQDIYVAVQSISTNEYGLFLDDFSGPNVFIPSCSKVDSIVTNTINSNGGVFSWPAISGVQGYQCDVYEQGNSPSNSVPVFSSVVTLNSVNISGLAPSSSYSFYLNTICTSTDTSDSRTIDFETPCAPYSAINEGFEITTDMPECWSVIDNASSSYGSVKAVTYTSPTYGNKHLRLYNGSSSTAKQFAITPSLIDLGNGTHRLRFTAKNGADEKLVIGTFSNPSDETTFSAIDTIELTDTEVEYTMNFTSPVTDQYIGFHLLATSSYKKIFIDEVVWEDIPSCVQPNQIDLISATSSSLNLTWDNISGASNFEIEYGFQDFTLGNGMTLNTNNSSESIISLLPGTTYDIRIKSVCSSSDSSAWSYRFPFTTDCEATSEVLENFEQTALNELPNCWSSIVNTTSTTASPYVKTVNTGSPANGDQQIALYNSSGGSEADLVLVSPEFISVNNKRIKLFARGGGQLKLGTLSNPTDLSTFVVLDSAAITTVSTEYEFMVPTASGSYFGFKIEPTTSYTYSYIDSIRIVELPSCIEPNTVETSIVSETEVQVYWTSQGSESNWIIEYGISGFNLGSGQILNTSSNPTTIAGLVYGDTLDFYIRALCSVTDTSDVSNPVSIIMECAPNLGLFNEDFSSYLPSCWSLAKGTLEINSNIEVENGTSSWSWKEDGYLNNGTTGASRMNIYGANAKHWLISPSINLEIGHTKSVEFDAALTDYNNGNAPDDGNFGSDDKVVVVISTDNGLNWLSTNALITFDTNNAPSHIGEHYIIDLSAYSGIVKIGFYGESTISNEDNDFSIDNFEISETLYQPFIDISLISIDMDENYCFNELVFPKFTVKNSGVVNIPEYSVVLDILGPQIHNFTQSITTPLNVNSTNQINFAGIPNLPSGLYAVVATVTIPTDSNVLNNSLTFAYTVEIPEILVLNTDTSICLGESLVLEASGSDQIIWNSNMANGSNVSPIENTVYTAVGTSVNGCQQTESFTVTVTPLPIVNIEYDNAVLSTENNYSTYTWQLNGIVVSTDSILMVSNNGVYTVEVTNEKGCSSTGTYEVNGLSIEDFDSEYSIFPNPTSGIVHIPAIENAVITVFNLSGIKVLSTNLKKNRFNMTQLPFGFYIVKVDYKKAVYQFKVSKI